ncbi:MAG: amidohydrolase family protein [Hyphomonadaceae bacterium]
MHVHVGTPPRIAALAESINSPRDWLLQRSNDPALFAEMMAEPQIDNSEVLLAKMDEYGVTHALIQPSPGSGSTNQLVADLSRRHSGRWFGLYRPEFLMADVGAGNTSQVRDRRTLARNARRAADDIQHLFPELGLIGVGEVSPGGFVSAEIDAVSIARDFGPVMEALRPHRRPIQFPTASSAWRGGLYYLYEPLWVDEVAGNFPDVPIVLAKMGRGIRSSFDACTVVAMRNANVYFDLTDTSSLHLREAINIIGAHRIMFGTDLSGISINYAHSAGMRIAEGAGLTQEEWDWISWRTADEVYRLGLEA